MSKIPTLLLLLLSVYTVNCNSCTPHPCPQSRFSCRGLTCLQGNQLCNGIQDCPSGFDEESELDCASGSNSPPSFSCGSGSGYIPLAKLCDCNSDCPNGIDEDLEICGIVVLNDANFVEGTQPNPVKVYADYEGTLTEPLIIPVTYTPGSADTNDFTMITQNIMFTPGDKQDYIEFDIVPDNQVEGIEFFTITAGIATAKIGIADTFATVNGGSMTAQNHHSVSSQKLDLMRELLDQLVGEVQEDATSVEIQAVYFSNANINVVEGAQASVCADYQGSVNQPITIPIITTFTPAGSADLGDFMMNEQNFVFTQGVTTDCILFDFVDDIEVEGIEWFTITAGSAIATIVIADNDDAFFMFTQGGYCTVEGTGPLVVTVKMAPSSGILGNPVQVKVQTVPAGDAVDGSDYVGGSFTHTFPVGSGPMDSEDFLIQITDDQVPENTETFSVVVTVSGTLVDTAMIYIDDNNCNTELMTVQKQDSVSSQNAGVFRFTTPVYDRDEGTGQAVVTVGMPFDSGVLVNPVPITVQTVNTGSATVGVDYHEASVTHTFPAGSGPGTMRDFDIQLIDDLDQENTETIAVRAITAGGALLDTTVVRIQDDDGNNELMTVQKHDSVSSQNAVFMFTQGGYSTVEGTGPVVVTVKMAPSSGILGNPVQVKVQTVPTGNAIDGSDYVGGSFTHTFPAGSGPGTMQDFVIKIIDDPVPENTETFSVEATVSGTVVDTAMIFIYDYDLMTVQKHDSVSSQNAGVFRFTTPVYDRDEGTGQAVVTVGMPFDSGVLGNPVPITVQTVNTGSATVGVDYYEANVTHTFPAGSGPGTMKQFVIQLIDDLDQENTETIAVRAITAGGALLDTTVVRIQDDDGGSSELMTAQKHDSVSSQKLDLLWELLTQNWSDDQKVEIQEDSEIQELNMLRDLVQKMDG